MAITGATSSPPNRVCGVSRRRLLQLAAAATLAVTGAAPAHADDYPSRRITIIVNFPPGAGALNLLVRSLADQAAKDLNQPVVVDYRAGAGGNIGAQHVATSAPDGYTLLASVDTTLTVNPWVYRSMPFDPVRGFQPLATLATFSQMLVINQKALPIKSFVELVQYAKKQPVLYASAGNGSPGHVVSEMLASAAGLKLEHVPYRGNAPATQALLAGETPMGFLVTSGVQPHVQSGRLTALAVSSTQRSKAMPAVPTVAESGYPEFVAEFGWVLMAPAGTPPAVAKVWNEQVKKLLATDEIRQRLLEWDIVASGAPAADTAARLERERRRWAEVVKRAGIQAE